jgi:hypothetical protein
MSEIRPPCAVKLFIGIIFGNAAISSSVVERLIRIFGPADFVSDAFPWSHTEYYLNEMGPNLSRQFVFFERPVDPGMLVWAKQTTVAIERDTSVSRRGILRRRVNLDPGYLTQAKIVLATGKDFPHRLYLGEGVYAESTLRYSKDAGGYLPWEHTYPDFRREDVLRWFIEARERLRKDLRESAAET